MLVSPGPRISTPNGGSFMNWKNTAGRYGSVSIGLHWLTLAHLIGVYACINLTERYAKGSPPREVLKDWHYMLGLMLLVLVALRLLNRLVAGIPPVVPPLPLWQHRLASATHIALYVLMIVMPILGGWRSAPPASRSHCSA
jgi:superoxide oxidase